MYSYVFVYLYNCVLVYISPHVSVYLFTWKPVHKYVCVYMCICTGVFMCVCVCVCVVDTQIDRQIDRWVDKIESLWGGGRYAVWVVGTGDGKSTRQACTHRDTHMLTRPSKQTNKQTNKPFYHSNITVYHVLFTYKRPYDMFIYLTELASLPACVHIYHIYTHAYLCK